MSCCAGRAAALDDSGGAGVVLASLPPAHPATENAESERTAIARRALGTEQRGTLVMMPPSSSCRRLLRRALRGTSSIRARFCASLRLTPCAIGWHSKALAVTCVMLAPTRRSLLGAAPATGTAPRFDLPIETGGRGWEPSQSGDTADQRPRRH